jgi:DNA polymerase I-like protein with 3'-5' exonuclease and polymerase domains
MARPFTINNHIALASEMMQVRLRVNQDHYAMLKQIASEEHTKCKAEVEGYTYSGFNVGSSKDVHGFLYGKAAGQLGLKVKLKHTPQGMRPTADENALRELRVEAPQHKELLNAFIKERHIKKKIESYIDVQFDEDGCIGYSANPAGTETNRWSFSKSPRERGFNPQTTPKVMRLMVEAPAGSIFICPDLPQADARIVAWDAQCERLIELFNDSTKQFHLENCIRLAGAPGSPFAGITRDIAYGTNDAGQPWKEYSIDQYTTGKAMGHAANYRMQAKRLAMELGIAVSDARKLLDIYLHQLYPEIARWQYSIKERVAKVGYLETPWPMLRRRTCYGAWAELMLRGKIADPTWNELCAHIPQSVVADIVNVGMEKLWEEADYVRFHKHDHDSYLASLPVARLGDGCRVALDGLRVTLRLHDRPLTMVPEMQYGRNYGALVEWKGEAEPDMARIEAAERKVLDEEKVRKSLYGYY